MKNILKIFILTLISISLLSAKDSAKCSHHHKNHNSNLFEVDVYNSPESGAKKVAKIDIKNKDTYSIFYCNNSGWCEVVNEDSGNTGWISIKKLNNAAKSYKDSVVKKMNHENMIKVIKYQDGRINELEARLDNFQTKAAKAIHHQSKQINKILRDIY